MPLRMLLRYLANNEQLVQKIAESYPVRRAAQITAYFFHRGKAIGEDAKERLEETQITDRLRDEARHMGRQVSHRATSFKDTFSQELQDGLRKMNEEIERQKRQK